MQSHVYRRPFDYSAPRRFYNQWLAVNAVEAAAGSAAFTTHQATVTASTVSTSIGGPTGSRFTSRGFFRRSWGYAQNNARIDLFYTDQQYVEAATAIGAFETYPATVAVGSQAATDIPAAVDAASFATYVAAVAQSVVNPLADNIGSFTPYPAEITGTYGIGVSRSGPAQIKSVGTYSAGTVRGAGRKAVTSITHAITRRK